MRVCVHMRMCARVCVYACVVCVCVHVCVCTCICVRVCVVSLEKRTVTRLYKAVTSAEGLRKCGSLMLLQPSKISTPLVVEGFSYMHISCVYS